MSGKFTVDPQALANVVAQIRNNAEEYSSIANQLLETATTIDAAYAGEEKDTREGKKRDQGLAHCAGGSHCNRVFAQEFSVYADSGVRSVHGRHAAAQGSHVCVRTGCEAQGLRPV